MPPPSLDLPTQRLLEHAEWIRALARQLTRDPAMADELEQQTWLAALEHPERDQQRARQWLTAVVRNFARQMRRGEGRRHDHEQRAARSEALPSAGDVVERAAVQREVVEAVLGLDEPYRTTILLRYFEGLAPRAIAKHRGLPVETVRTHLKRGIGLLRVRLDATHGNERRTWIAALLPLAGAADALRSAPAVPAPNTATPISSASQASTATQASSSTVTQPSSSLSSAATHAALGTLLMNAKLKLLVGALIVAGLFSAWYAQLDRPVIAESPAAPAPATPLLAAQAPQSTSTALSEPRATAEAASQRELAPQAAVVPPSAPPAQPLLHGQVLDARGAPAAGVALGFESDAARPERVATSGADGRFEIGVPADSRRLIAIDAQFATVFAGVCGRGVGKAEPVVVVAARATVAGRVLDEGGTALAHVELRVDLPPGYRTRFQRVMDYAVELTRRTESDAEGRFRIDPVALVDDAQLSAALDGFEPFHTPLASFTGEELLITLARPRIKDGIVRGRVIDAAGNPAAEARVAFGVVTTSSEADGSFTFPLEDPNSINAQLKVQPTTLAAVKKGYQPANYSVPQSAGKPAWPALVVLRLGDVPLAIEGRVVDHKGNGMPKAKVWIADATFFGLNGEHSAMVENMLAGDDKAFWHFVNTDDAGRYRIDGLLARDYSVRAMDPDTLLRAEKGPVAAGSSGVELRLPTDTLYPRVAGRVLSHSGQPIAKAHIFPMCDAFQARFQGQVLGTSHDALEGVSTDAQGRFELLNVPRSLVYLRVEGEDILPLEYGRYVEGDERFVNSIKELPKDQIDRLAITVDRRCHFQVELADPTSADELAVLDDAGTALTINIFLGNGRRENPRAPIVAGRSHTMAVSDMGKTLVVYLAGKEVMRAPLKLTPGELKKLRL